MLEPIEVEQQHTDDRTATPCPPDGLVETVDQELAIGETGQLVVQAALLERAGGFLLLRDVPHDGGRDGPTVDRRTGDRDTRLELRAVRADGDDVHRHTGSHRAAGLAHPHPGLVGARDQVDVRRTDDVGGREAEDALGRLVELENRAVVVTRDDRVGSGFEDAAHAQLRHAQRVFGSPARIDVVHAQHQAADLGIMEAIRDRALEPPVIAVGAQQAQLDHRRDRRVSCDRKKSFDNRVAVVGMHEVDRATAEYRVYREPEQRLHGRRHPRKTAVDARDRDDVGAVLRQRGRPRPRVDEITDVVGHERDDIGLHRHGDEPPPRRRARRQAQVSIGFGPSARGQRRFEDPVDRAAVELIDVRGEAASRRGCGVRHPTAADRRVLVDDLPVGEPIETNGAEDHEPDPGAFQRGPRELSHIGFRPHLRSIGGAITGDEGIKPAATRPATATAGMHHPPEFSCRRGRAGAQARRRQSA